MERKWWTLIVVCVAIFMLLLDITVVNVALPDIQRELHTSFTDLQWIVDAYALMLATFMLNAGSLADLLGRKRVFVTGVVLFTAASAACGSATSPLFLNLARGGGAAARFRGRGGAPAGADARPVALSRADVHRRPDRRLHDVGGDVLAVPLPHVVHAERARLLADRRRPPLPAALDALVPDGAARGTAVGTGARPRADRHRAHAERGGAAAHARHHAQLGLDNAARGLRRRRHRHRAREPAAGVDGRQRRAAATGGNGVPHQQHVPPGGDRDRHRGARRRLSAPQPVGPRPRAAGRRPRPRPRP